MVGGPHLEVPVLLQEAVGHLPVRAQVPVRGRDPVDDPARLRLHLDRRVVRQVHELWGVVVHVLHLGLRGRKEA